MRKIILTMAVLSLVLLSSGAIADDLQFSSPLWHWNLQDYPRWHYQEDGGADGTDQYGAIIYYIQLELKYSENTLVEPNVINMRFVVIYSPDGEHQNYKEFYFDIHPGVTEQVEQFTINDTSWGEQYTLVELNTIPEGNGWIVIDFENSWLDLFTNVGIAKESLGKLKAGYQ